MEKEKKFKVFDAEYIMQKSTYRNNGNTYICMSNVYDPGDYWDLSINFEEKLPENEMYLNHDFISYAPKELQNEVMEYLFESPVPVDSKQSGFVLFGKYRLKDGILNTIRGLEE